MYPVLLTAALAMAQPGSAGTTDTARGGRSATDATPMLDGQWTVVSFERQGQPVSEAKNATVRVENNVVTFTGGTGNERFQQKAMRLDLMPRGMIRVSEADANRSGTGTETGSGSGSGTGTGTGDRTGGTGTGGTAGAGAGDRTGATGHGGHAGAAGAKTGVYVMSRDFLAVSLHDDAGVGSAPAGTGAGTGAGSDRTGSGTGSGTGAGAGGSTSLSGQQPAIVVVLQRSGATGGTTTPGGSR